MLADEGLAIAEPVGEHDRLAVLAQHVRIGPRRRVDGLDEESEFQFWMWVSLNAGIAGEAHKQKAPTGAAGRGLASNYAKR